MNNKKNINIPAKISFLGTGNSHSKELGNSSCVLNIKDKELVIDMGYTAYYAYKEKYNKFPENIFITHCHIDHIGGLENLFYSVAFSNHPLIKLYVPSKIVHLLHRRMASLESMVAEGGKNFWDAFQLIPVEDTFWFDEFKFKVFENRHHAMGFSFGIALQGRFLYTGDTKPIPEIISTLASQGEVIFHDASTTEQPSHSFLNEILSSYTNEQKDNMKLYHLASSIDQEEAKNKGFEIVKVDVEYKI